MAKHFSDAQVFNDLLLDLLSQGKSVSMRGGGKSMLPKIEDGSSLIIDPILRRPRTGDILVFTQNSNVMIHRVVSIKKTTTGSAFFLMKGDANFKEDGWIPEDQVYGIVRDTEHRLSPTIMIRLRNIVTGIYYQVWDTFNSWLRFVN